MELTRKDALATGLTALAVVVFVAAVRDWGWLVGSSNRWAAGVIVLLGAFTCGLGSPDKGTATKFLAALGITALVLAVLAIVTGASWALALLTIDIVVLWAASTLRHAVHAGHTPVAT